MTFILAKYIIIYFSLNIIKNKINANIKNKPNALYKKVNFPNLIEF